MQQVKFLLFNDGRGFTANLDGHKVGEITFVRIGNDKLIIDYTAVDEPYRHESIGLNLVRHVCDLARTQHRHVIALCPFAQAMFNRHSEFDDVRLINAH